MNGILCIIHTETIPIDQCRALETELGDALGLMSRYNEITVARLCSKYGVLHEYKVV